MVAYFYRQVLCKSVHSVLHSSPYQSDQIFYKFYQKCSSRSSGLFSKSGHSALYIPFRKLPFPPKKITSTNFSLLSMVRFIRNFHFNSGVKRSVFGWYKSMVSHPFHLLLWMWWPNFCKQWKNLGGPTCEKWN